MTEYFILSYFTWPQECVCRVGIGMLINKCQGLANSLSTCKCKASARLQTFLEVKAHGQAWRWNSCRSRLAQAADELFLQRDLTFPIDVLWSLSKNESN